MAQLIVRGLDDGVKALLQKRASRHGKSMEAEVRDILRDALKDDPSEGEGLGTRISRRFLSIGLRSGETIPELRGERTRDPLEE